MENRTQANASLFAQQLHMHAYSTNTLLESDRVGVNIYKNPYDRYPTDTVWFFDTNNAVSWGPNFEYTANAGDPSLVDLVIETLK